MAQNQAILVDFDIQGTSMERDRIVEERGDLLQVGEAVMQYVYFLQRYDSAVEEQDGHDRICLSSKLVL